MFPRAIDWIASTLCVVLLLAVVPAVATAGVGGPDGSLPGVTDNPSERSIDRPDAPLVAVRTTARGNGTGPRIVEVYPNPVAENNVGEYVVVDFPEPTNVSGWTLTDDGRGEATLPNATVEGRVAFSFRPDLASNHTDAPASQLSGWLRPAASGDRIELRSDGVVVDAVEYGRAPEGDRWLRADGGTWVPVGATDHDVTNTGPTTIRSFVLPDGAEVPESVLRSADDRLYVGAYTLTSGRIVDALLDAHDRGVDVRVLVDGSPVGGVSRRQVSALDRLSEGGVEVTVLGGAHARYRFHHAKYAVADDRALVLTENWKPSGTGGRSSRGWGVVVEDRRIADDLAAVFEGDAAWRAGRAWDRYRETVDPVEADPATGQYPERFEPERVRTESVRLLVTPDNAERALLDLLSDAEDSIRIQQVSLGGTESALASATIDAARRGVAVEIQLSSAWYVEEENRALADRLRTLAAEENLDLTVTLVDPHSRFDRVHTKGAVIDGEHVVLGSINWNDHSLRENREVAVLIEGDAAAEYYGDVLTADRRGGVWRLPVGLGIVVLLGGATTAAIVAWRIRWRPRSRGSCSPAPRRSRRQPSSRRARRGPPPDDP